MQSVAHYISLLLVLGSALILGGIGFFHINAIEQYFGGTPNMRTWLVAWPGSGELPAKLDQ